MYRTFCKIKAYKSFATPGTRGLKYVSATFNNPILTWIGSFRQTFCYCLPCIQGSMYNSVIFRPLSILMN